MKMPRWVSSIKYRTCLASIHKNNKYLLPGSKTFQNIPSVNQIAINYLCQVFLYLPPPKHLTMKQ